jgi:hypothetical protein
MGTRFHAAIDFVIQLKSFGSNDFSLYGRSDLDRRFLAIDKI